MEIFSKDEIEKMQCGWDLPVQDLIRECAFVGCGFLSDGDTHLVKVYRIKNGDLFYLLSVKI